MNTDNTPPPLPTTKALENLRSGQRLVIVGILLNLVAILLRIIPPDNALLIIGGLLGVAAIVISIVGLLRMGAGLGVHLVWRIFLCILMIVPLINLLILFIMNSRATKQLTQNGYKVGFLGAPKKQ
jgi:hypothetical protein